MPRAVVPWTWRRALRDHGPRNPSVLLTCFVIGTYMDRDGIAYPSQQLIAAGIRASVKTVQRHIALAATQGWLGIEYAGRGGKGWRHFLYRASVPDGLELDERSELIACAVTAQNGEVLSPAGNLPGAHRGDTIVSSASTHRGDNGNVKVATFGHEGGDTGVPKVATQLCRTNSCSETPASRTRASEEAHNAQSHVMRARVENGNGRKEIKTPKKSNPRELTDQRLRALVLKMDEAGIGSVTEAVKVLQGNYDDVTCERVWRVLKAPNHGSAP